MVSGKIHKQTQKERRKFSKSNVTNKIFNGLVLKTRFGMKTQTHTHAEDEDTRYEGTKEMIEHRETVTHIFVWRTREKRKLLRHTDCAERKTGYLWKSVKN